jgi:hypothetical protein
MGEPLHKIKFQTLISHGYIGDLKQANIAIAPPLAIFVTLSCQRDVRSPQYISPTCLRQPSRLDQGNDSPFAIGAKHRGCLHPQLGQTSSPDGRAL